MDVIQEQFNENNFQKVTQILLIAGAINWGLVAFNQTDIVTFIATTIGYTKIDYYIKLIVGVAGIYALIKLILQFTKEAETKK